MAFRSKRKTQLPSSTSNPDLRPTGPERQLTDGRWENCRHYIPAEDPSDPRIIRLGSRSLPKRVTWVGPGPHYHSS